MHALLSEQLIFIFYYGQRRTERGAREWGHSQDTEFL